MCDKIIGMKKELLKHILTSVVAVAGLALLFVMSQSVIAQSNGYGSSNLLQLSGFNLEKFQLSPTDYDAELGDNSPYLNALPSEVAFRNFGSSILNQTSVVNNAFFDHKEAGEVADLNIGFDSFNVPDIARLQVGGGQEGTVQVQALADANDPNIYCVCANQYGEMRRCGIYDPANGQLCSGTVQQTIYSCTGPTPTNATMCGGDNSSLTANTPNTVVNACTATKCEYTCNEGYVLQGGTCVLEPEDETYSWVTSSWGSCMGLAGSCSGSWTTTSVQTQSPVDWNGDEFNWTDGTVYEADGTIVAYCGINNDLETGDNMNGMGPAGTACLMVWYDPEFPAGIMYEYSVERDSWDQLTVNASGVVTNVIQNFAPAYGVTSGIMYRKRCDMNNNGTWADDTLSGYCLDDQGEWENTGVGCNPITNDTLPALNGVNATGTVVDGENIVCLDSGITVNFCEGAGTAAACTSQHRNCVWTPGGGGTQTRTVTCQNSEGVTVANDLCAPPAPATSQSC